MLSRFKGLISRIKKSKDSSTLASNFGYLMLLQIAGYVFPLITIPYLARVIGVEGFGKIAFAAAVILWFSTISEWGFNYTATRDVAKNRDNLTKINAIFSNVLWARMAIGVASFFVLLVLIAIVPFFYENRLILLITFLSIPGHILFPDWFFQAMERMKYITLLNLLTRIIFTLMIFLFIKEKSDYVLQPALLALGNMVSGLIAMYIIVVKWGVRIIKPNWSEIFVTIKKSTDVFVMNIMPNFYFGFSTALLGFVGGASSVGLLDAGRKFSDLANQFMKILSRVFFPYLARNKNKHYVYARLNLATAICFFIAVAALSPLLIKLFFTPEFYPAITVLQVSALSIIFLSLRDVYGINYLVSRGHDAIARNVIIKTSVLGFLLAFFFVYKFDYIGAALVTVIIHLLQGGLMFYEVKKIERIKQ